MNKAIIKAFYRSFAAAVVMLAAQVFTSCMNDDDVVTSPNCAITSFSVGSIKSYVPVKKYDAQGNATDTLVARTIMGSDIYFNIDQINNRIATVDSLASWIDLTRVVPTFNCYGNVYMWLPEDTVYRIVQSGTDSLDFSKPVELVCVATDGVSSKRYTLEMKKASVSIDTLEWKHLGKAVALQSADKVLGNNGTVIAFGVDADGSLACSTSSNGLAWSEPRKVDASSIDAQSVVLFKGEYYALDSDGSIMRSADGAAWSEASQQKAVRLLAADNMYLYIYDGESILGTTDMAEWIVQGRRDLGMLPSACISCASYPSRTNSDITVSVMTGLLDNGTGKAVAWYKLSAADSNVNQHWAYIGPTPDNGYALPALSHISMTRYGSALYLIGTQDNVYTSIFRSVDNGITWQRMSGNYSLPADLDIRVGGRASFITVGDQLWVVQQDGNVWAGVMR